MISKEENENIVYLHGIACKFSEPLVIEDPDHMFEYVIMLLDLHDDYEFNDKAG